MGEKNIGGLDVPVQYRLGALSVQVIDRENQLYKPHPSSAECVNVCSGERKLTGKSP